MNPQIVESPIIMTSKFLGGAIISPILVTVFMEAVFKEKAIKYSLPFPFFVALAIYGFIVKDSINKYKQTIYSYIVQAISLVIFYLTSWLMPAILRVLYGKLPFTYEEVSRLYWDAFGHSQNVNLHIMCGGVIIAMAFGAIVNIWKEKNLFVPVKLSEEEITEIGKQKKKEFKIIIASVVVPIVLLGVIWLIFADK